ncbi:metal-dependent hydrolase [Candidatus Pacearchaeota archaeon]|nr:metal-dependent hydrolase [Candidatus Pacearchaeota archaeon]
MPYAVTHILVPLLAVALWRDYYLRKSDKRSFPLHYVLLAGLGGIIPDLDIALFWLLQLAGIDASVWSIHKTYLHSFIIPLIFLGIAGITHSLRFSALGKHKLKLSVIALMFVIGSFTHVSLDLLLGEPFSPFLPFHEQQLGFSFFSLLPEPVQGLFYPTLDAALLIVYLIYLEWKHKISDFI